MVIRRSVGVKRTMQHVSECIMKSVFIAKETGKLRTTLYPSVSRLFKREVDAQPFPRTTKFFFEGSKGSCLGGCLLTYDPVVQKIKHADMERHLARCEFCGKRILYSASSSRKPRRCE